MSKIRVLTELWTLMRTRRKMWLAPVVVFLVLVGVLLVMASGSPLATFIYTLF
jgi:Family of unknown function (DUF5989)